jgi:hypothetical protein
MCLLLVTKSKSYDKQISKNKSCVASTGSITGSGGGGGNYTPSSTNLTVKPQHQITSNLTQRFGDQICRQKKGQTRHAHYSPTSRNCCKGRKVYVDYFDGRQWAQYTGLSSVQKYRARRNASQLETLNSRA